MLMVANKRGGKTKESRLVKIEAPASAKSRRKRRRSRKGSLLSIGGAAAIYRGLSAPAKLSLTEYVNTLNNPFDYGPLRLGYDCYVETELTTAYLRYSFAPASDGSFGVNSWPQVTPGFISVANTSITSPSWTGYAASNSAVILQLLSSMRLVSGGIRVVVLNAATSVPGVLYAGSMPRPTFQGMNSTSVQSLIAVSDTKIGIGTQAAAALARPVDSGSYHFDFRANGGFYVEDFSPTSVPYVCGTGFPSGSTVWVECVQNFEALTKTAAWELTAGDVIQTTVSDSFPSADQLFKAAKPHISVSGIVEGMVGLLAKAIPFGGALLSLSKTAFGNHRASRFGLPTLRKDLLSTKQDASVNTDDSRPMTADSTSYREEEKKAEATI